MKITVKTTKIEITVEDEVYSGSSAMYNHCVPDLLDAVKAICNEAIIVHENVVKSKSGT